MSIPFDAIVFKCLTDVKEFKRINKDAFSSTNWASIFEISFLKVNDIGFYLCILKILAG